MTINDICVLLIDYPMLLKAFKRSIKNLFSPETKKVYIYFDERTADEKRAACLHLIRETFSDVVISAHSVSSEQLRWLYWACQIPTYMSEGDFLPVNVVHANSKAVFIRRPDAKTQKPNTRAT